MLGENPWLARRFPDKIFDSTELRDYRLRKRKEFEDLIRRDRPNKSIWVKYIKWEEQNDFARARYIHMEEMLGNVGGSRQISERWMRWMLNQEVWLSINYALYEELDAQDVDRARDIYRHTLFDHHLLQQDSKKGTKRVLKKRETIRHEKISFAKMRLMDAQLEIRQSNIDRARRILGLAIGMAPKDKIFKTYIEIELKLGNMDRCRKLYEKYLEWSPQNCYAWIKFAELEISLGETERVRAIFELAVDQPALNMPESEYERARAPYESLLDRTKDLKVWISYAKFEASELSESNYEQKEKCRLRARDKKIKSYILYEEYTIGNLKILEAAYSWKKHKILQ
ncbi:hypothetical protein DH2020_000485 [Rehmannia glutinosa]|uniref:Crooked neck-like protein n=1 Tax=Rehmannia glutinosa TaxID=99300 RepID=A0ABR0XX29_REHGL